jgi:ribosomal protein S18 acetylase RimI-like enzyme
MKTCYFKVLDPMHIAIADLVRPGELTRSWTITRINVPHKYRGHGFGSELLRRICNDADADQVSLRLEVSPSDGPDYDELTEWYWTYGFRTTNSGYMKRLPREV